MDIEPIAKLLVVKTQAERFGEKGRDPDWIWKESRNFYANYYSIPSMAVT